MARLPVARKSASAGLLDVLRSQRSTFVMAAILLVLGFLLVYPVFLLLILSFNTAPEMFFGPREWGLGNWRVAFRQRANPEGCLQHIPRLGYDGRHQLARLGGHSLGPRPHPRPVQPYVGVPVLGRLRHARRRHRMDAAPRPGHRVHQSLVDAAAVHRRSAVRYLQRKRDRLGWVDGQRHRAQGDAAHPSLPQYGRGARGGGARQRGFQPADGDSRDGAADDFAHRPRARPPGVAYLPGL